MTSIRDAAASDEAAWRRLWDGYLVFYGASLDERVTAETWRRILDPASPLIGRVASRAGAVEGFTVSVIHAGTWTSAPVCYLEDLFVDPAARGYGVGQALIQDLVDLGRSRGWSRLYWHTQAGKASARRLDDRFARADDCVRYRRSLD